MFHVKQKGALMKRYGKILIIGIVIILLGLFFIVNEQKNIEKRRQFEIITMFSQNSDFREENLQRYLNLYQTINRSVEDIILLVNHNVDQKEGINYALACKILKEPYYMEKNFERYIAYFNVCEACDFSTLIAIVNVNGDKEPYTDSKRADLNQNETILVNRYHYLEENDIPELVLVDLKDCKMKNVKMNPEAYQAYQKMRDDAIAQGNTIMINGNNAYRDYNEQSKVFDWYVTCYDYEVALQYACKPGYSEHQTGLAVDIMFNFKGNQSYSYKDYQWLIDNSWKYGFILRFPEGKERITKNSYEPWHYRYVGVQIATFLHDHDLTFDEYYHYYLECESS